MSPDTVSPSEIVCTAPGGGTGVVPLGSDARLPAGRMPDAALAGRAVRAVRGLIGGRTLEGGCAPGTPIPPAAAFSSSLGTEGAGAGAGAGALGAPPQSRLTQSTATTSGTRWRR